MDFLAFLNALENTLNEIDVKGKKNLDYMTGCFIAIDNARNFLLQQSQINKQEGDDENGRQSDIGFDDSDTDKD